MKKFLLKK